MRMLRAPFIAGLAAVPAKAAEVVVFCPGAVQSVVRDLVKSYEEKSGNTVKLQLGTAGDVVKRVADGAPGDVVIATDNGLAGLAKIDKIVPSSVRALGGMGVGIAVKAGAPKPDIHDVDSFKKSMLAARSIMYGDPGKGGQSGIHIAKVFVQLGIDRQIAPRLQLRDSGPVGLKEVAKGDIEIGLGQVSEIIENKDVVLVGSFPLEIQGAVTFTAAVHSASFAKPAAEAFVQVLTTPEAQAKFKAFGFTVD